MLKKTTDNRYSNYQGSLSAVRENSMQILTTNVLIWFGLRPKLEKKQVLMNTLRNQKLTLSVISLNINFSTKPQTLNIESSKAKI